MKFYFLSFTYLLTISLFSFSTHAQESLEIDGKSYFIYPHSKDCYLSWAFVQATNKKNDVNNKLLFKLFYPDQALDLENYEENFNFFEKDYINGYSQYKTPAKSIKYIRENPEKFYESFFNLHNSLTPSIETIKDGNYVQLYNQFLEMDEKGNLRVNSERVAGFFTIKNGIIDGFAYWLNPIGDTIEKGNYQEGKKVGTWQFLERKDISTNYDDLLKKPVYDKVIAKYEDGVLEGEYLEYVDTNLVYKGNYSQGKAVGEWFVYGAEEVLENGKFVLKYYLREHFFYKKENLENPIVSNHPVIRNRPFEKMGYPDSLNFDSGTELLQVNFNSFFKFYQKYEEDLELPEEKTSSYEGEDYGAINRNNLYLNYNYEITLDGKSYPKGKLIDSIGVVYLFDHVYENFYSNGKRKFKYEFKDGKLVKEDTLFWDNGQAANVITFDSLKNEFYSFYYDYDGKLFQKEVLDSIGVFKSKPFNLLDSPSVLIDNLEAKSYLDFGFYEYNKYDTLLTKIEKPLTFYKSWYSNKKPNVEITFDPIERIANLKVKGINQKEKMNIEYLFGEDYKFFSAVSKLNFGALQAVITSNGAFEGKHNDSIPEANIKELNRNYEVTDDYQLLNNEKPFSGKFVMNLEKKKAKFKIKENSVEISLGREKYVKKLISSVEKYLKDGGKNDDLLYSFIEFPGRLNSDITNLIPNLNDLSEINSFEEYQGESEYGAEGFDYYGDNQVSIIKIEGQFLDGKPSGTWKSYDERGEIRTEVSYLKGELDGSVKYFQYAYPMGKGYDDYYDEFNPDDYPLKKTYFLEHVRTYKNGILNGLDEYYNWKGEVTYTANFKDGYLNGKVVERSNLINSISNYEEGMLDGIAKTTMTLPERDSIVLYELNFQNHQLQGESKAFHPNGKLAKRGFFLNGEPIDDYEAYDSLGTIYQYVKFQYSYPIEEKIWEENELSVLYQYDWKDSIYFIPSDLVNVPSTFDLMYEYGLVSDGELNTAYSGRESIIQKTGIKYRVTKFYPDEVIARDGEISSGKKVGCWIYNNYAGQKMYEIDYFDTILKINDSIKFKSKGIRTDFDTLGNQLFQSYLIEKVENYDCSHTDHYELRQFMTISQTHDSINRFNNYVKNYYDNGTLQSEGNMKEGLPTGVWKFYTPNGQLNQVGEYVQGKRDGRWLKGDLSNINYLGDICMNPNLPDLEKKIKYQENLIDVQIRYFKLGKIKKTETYDINNNK